MDAGPKATTGRPRVLVETPLAPWHWLVKQALSLSDYDVRLCGGPDAQPDHECPLAGGRACPMAEEADVVVTGLGLDDPRTRDIVAALRAEHPATPVIVLTKQGEARRHADLLAGCEIVMFPWTTTKLSGAVSSALKPTAS
jgi:DNA-binding NtrC family response regulator